jgi:hypothetical protein
MSQVGGRAEIKHSGSRAVLNVTCDEQFYQLLKCEIADKAAEIVAINYKYDFFKNNVKLAGLNSTEYEILMASLIAADLEEDKKYSYDKMKNAPEIAVDGLFNFRMQPLKRKWVDIVSYIPSSFINSQLKDFITYLLENKKKRVYIDSGKVYDSHYRLLKRSNLLGGGDAVKLVREVLLSNCGEVELIGAIPKDDEYYLKEFYTDKIIFSGGLS